MPIIDFGPSSRSTFVVPKFGKTCVCCNQDAQGRTQDYDASTDRIHADVVAMPVCFGCRDHAFQGHTGPILAAAGFCVGTSGTGLGAFYVSKRPHDALLWGVLAVGVAILAVSVVWIVRSVRAERRDRAIPGHHARLWFTVGHGSTRLITRNEMLADELIARNPSAKRMLTRAEAKQIPAARVVGGGGPAIDHDELASSIAQRVIANKPDDLAALRGELAAGSVRHALVEQLLAETETTLGRRDLIARYRALRSSE